MRWLLLISSLSLFSCAQTKRKEPINIDMKNLISDIRAKLENSVPEFKSCYLKKRLPFHGQRQLQRTLYLNFKINSKGLVSKSDLRSDEVIEEPIKQCILGHLQNITFSPVPEDGSIEVKQPLRFKLKS